MWRDVKMHTRAALGVRRLVRNRITIDEARRIVKHYLDQRENHFLQMIDRGVFGHKASPYLPLFEMASVEYGDVARMVRDSGIEKTLRNLRHAGIYVGFEELKGRTPIVRNGREFPTTPTDFDNPHSKPSFFGETGGTTGAPTRSPRSFETLAAQAAHDMVALEAEDCLDYPWVIWRGGMPDTAGLTDVLGRTHLGRVPDHWFSPVTGRDQGPNLWKYRIGTRVPLLMALSAGVRIPSPERLRLDDAGVIADWLATTLADVGGAALRAPVSSALRVAIAAIDQGQDLTGSVFCVSGEPITPAKAKGIAASGARITTRMGLNEIGTLGLGCPEASDITDLHLTDGLCAMIQHEHHLADMNVSVPALHLTSLLPSSPMILLNMEMDDYAVLESRACGCGMGDLGLTTHVTQVRSFRKLTGEGMTLVGNDMIRILEEVLPTRFGGSPLDYQLAEVEDEAGFTRFLLRVHPRVSISSESDVLETVMKELTTKGRGVFPVELWKQAKTLQIDRRAPVWSSRGKLQALNIDRQRDK